MDGVIVIRKEKGFTSHDVVAKLRGILHMKKIGHTGTLDPDAEGVQHSKEHSYWTQKGRLFIYEFLKQKDILPLIEIDHAA